MSRLEILQLTVALSLAIAPVQAADGADSAEALAMKLDASRTFGEVVGCIHPGDRAHFGNSLLAMARMAILEQPGDPVARRKIEEEWTALLAKSKVRPPDPDAPPPADAEEQLARLQAPWVAVDMKAFADDAEAFLRRNSSKDPAGDALLGIPRGKLENVNVHEQMTTGEMGGTTVRFAPLDGRWYLRP